MITIESLRLIWWLLLGIVLMGFAITDGWDLGAAVIYPLIARTDTERRIVLNAIAPFWEGNQVWIILGAGAIFAAWPLVYAVAFSGSYFVVLLILLTMGILRPPSFKYRSKIPNPKWRSIWDKVIFCGGFFPAILFGMLVGNVLLGLPFYFDNDLRIVYSGTFLGLLNPFAFWCGLTSLAMFVMHGGFYISLKTNSPVRDRAILYSRFAAVLLVILFAGGGFLIATQINGYVLLSGADPLGYSNPLHKEVVPRIGAYLDNYERYPITMLLPLLGFVGALLAAATARIGSGIIAFICSALSIVGLISTVGISMFPFILPSAINLSSGLTVWDASSSALTLVIMLGATIVFLPIVLMYTSWVFYVMRGPVTAETVTKEKQSY